MPEATAFAAIDRFLGLGAHLALSDALPEGTLLDEAFPHCAVKLAYRKKGAPKAQSLSMIFIGFNDEADALAYAERFPPCRWSRAGRLLAENFTNGARRRSPSAGSPVDTEAHRR